jgi:hypothetical protein
LPFTDPLKCSSIFPDRGVFDALWDTKDMSHKQLILHVGFHKSGTSALQESFSAQRAGLAAEGVLYPNIGRKAHHRIAWALTQKPWGWKARGGETTPFKHFSKMVRLVNRSGTEKIVLSSEFFSELSPDQIQKIAGAIKGREVKVLFTLRPLVKLLASSYQQYLKYGTKADYVEWLHSVLDEPGVSKINPTFWKRHMHGDVVARWSEVFGAQSVTVVIADEAKPEFLYESVNELLGLSKDFLKAQSTGSNRSLSLEEVSLLLELNRKFPKEREWSEYLTFVRNGYIRQLTDHVPIKEGSAKLLTPTWAIEKANVIAATSKQKIKASGAKVLGDIESLDTATVPTGEPTYPTSIDIETVSAAMLGFDRRLARRLPIRWILSALKNKIKAQLRFLDR